jgi:hypothetical protein
LQQWDFEDGSLLDDEMSTSMLLFKREMSLFLAAGTAARTCAKSSASRRLIHLLCCMMGSEQCPRSLTCDQAEMNDEQPALGLRFDVYKAQGLAIGFRGSG